ncbi:hypothetical protein IRJ41_010246 [Triplophysa rosa]|uniref:Uncharacterized protein n=1 Tax=Triplophysa rosa TaxID=992332 RepID=A0A9W7THT3_TRIRA|nr:hypothetical protein IRJ41_010246 [Triplophysa rosa]
MRNQGDVTSSEAQGTAGALKTEAEPVEVTKEESEGMRSSGESKGTRSRRCIELVDNGIGADSHVEIAGEHGRIPENRGSGEQTELLSACVLVIANVVKAEQRFDDIGNHCKHLTVTAEDQCQEQTSVEVNWDSSVCCHREYAKVQKKHEQQNPKRKNEYKIQKTKRPQQGE